MQKVIDKLLTDYGQQKLIDRDSIYISQGQIFKRIFLIRKGIIRSFYINEKGEDKTILFSLEGMFYGVVDSLFFNQQSTRFWQAMEDTELIEIDFNQVVESSKNDVNLLNVRIYFLELLLVDTVKRLESFVRDSSEERYLNLLKQKNDLVNRIPDKYLASYIGVTPVTLSRIRKKLAYPKK